MDQERRVIIMMDFFSMLLARAGISGGGGGGGFTPTDEQLAAMDSGITAAKLSDDETDISNLKTKTQGINSTANNKIEMGNGTSLFIGPELPTGAKVNDLWIGG